jgi:acyl carrier protein
MQTVDYNSLRQFITDNFLFGQTNGLSDQDSFLEKGIIDSTGVLELVSFLEREYGIKIEDHELVQQNLDSIQNLMEYVDRKLSRPV